MNNEYKRGYRKGYSTGCHRSDAAMSAERERANRAAKRAEYAETAQGLGHCEECVHWARGGGGPSASACAWGHCQASMHNAGTPWGCWARSDDNKMPLVTTPRFGCMLFIQRDYTSTVSAAAQASTDLMNHDFKEQK